MEGFSGDEEEEMEGIAETNNYRLCESVCVCVLTGMKDLLLFGKSLLSVFFANIIVSIRQPVLLEQNSK